MTGLGRLLPLLDPPPERPDLTRGYLDLLGADARPRETLAQRLMRSAALPKIYEDVWRPLVFGLSKGGPFGPSTEEEYALVRDWLGLSRNPAGTVLDVACGPGNVTRALATGMTGHGLVVGVDAAQGMLERAVAGTRPPVARGRGGAAGIAYVRGDAARLPFREAAFDAVCCLGGLYLFDDPWAAIDGMARVLRPGGRVVLLTTRRPGTPVVGAGSAVLGRLTGIRMFTSDEVSGALATGGFTGVRRRSYGLMQVVGGTRA